MCFLPLPVKINRSYFYEPAYFTMLISSLFCNDPHLLKPDNNNTCLPAFVLNWLDLNVNDNSFSFFFLPDKDLHHCKIYHSRNEFITIRYKNTTEVRFPVEHNRMPPVMVCSAYFYGFWPYYRNYCNLSRGRSIKTPI